MVNQSIHAEPPTVDEWKPCIVIPVYNHEQAIGGFARQILSSGLPVFLINDGSSAECCAVLQALAGQHSAISLINLPKNIGKGGAVKQGLLAALEQGFSHALQVDADGQHSAEDIERFLIECRNQPEAIVAGYPVYDQSVPAYRFYARYLTHVWICINTLSFKIKDSMCGFRLYPLKQACELIAREKIGNRMDFDSEILVRWVWRDGKVVNIPTKVSYPLDGVSHFELWRDNVLISRMHARLFAGMLLRLPRLLYKRLLP